MMRLNRNKKRIMNYLAVLTLILAMLTMLVNQFVIAHTIEARDNSTVAKLSIIATNSESGDVRWVLPGLRRLDPMVFGTPDQPLGTEPPLIGVPIEGRLTTEDGTAFTTTKDPTPFGDNATIITGNLEMILQDFTLVDDINSKDKIDFSSTFTSPDGKTYEVIVNKRIAVGDDHPFFGGIATDFMHHGATAIGSKLMPALYTYAAFWGVGVLKIDGVEVANNRLVHMMVTGNVRDEEYRLALTSAEINENELMLHLILPPIEVTPQGPIESPVATQFILPNSMQQPFLHINFHDVEVEDLIDEETAALEDQISALNNQFYLGLGIGIVGIITAVVALAIRRRP